MHQGCKGRQRPLCPRSGPGREASTQSAQTGSPGQSPVGVETERLGPLIVGHLRYTYGLGDPNSTACRPPCAPDHTTARSFGYLGAAATQTTLASRLSSLLGICLYYKTDTNNSRITITLQKCWFGSSDAEVLLNRLLQCFP